MEEISSFLGKPAGSSNLLLPRAGFRFVFSQKKKNSAFHKHCSLCCKTNAKTIFRDACEKRKREDPPGRKRQPQAFSAASEEKRAAGNLK
ncbi:hypothetical protein C6Y45_03205 [Alkalicoccus saliphilus]|uniref:Uncharacterized protein n=1 Tax=Alkalicoccus saliphilus TaxID=200989 RepID=A0A2T4U9B5_9BACI|nr:hypothetical protein C6Y45_03205 [Alkalicoccus saliphilus]